MNHPTASWVSCVIYESISWAHKIRHESVSNSASYMNQLCESYEWIRYEGVKDMNQLVSLQVKSVMWVIWMSQVSYVNVTQLSDESYFMASPDRLIIYTNDTYFTDSHKSTKWLMSPSPIISKHNLLTDWAKATISIGLPDQPRTHVPSDSWLANVLNGSGLH